MPGIFLPTHTLDICFALTEDPPQNVMNLVALLAWVTQSEANQYYAKLKRNIEETIKADEERERWKNHSLYRTQKCNLKVCAKVLKIPVTAAPNKHQLVSLVSQKKKEDYPELKQPLYGGKLALVPTSATSLSKLTVAKLRAIIKFQFLDLKIN